LKPGVVGKTRYRGWEKNHGLRKDDGNNARLVYLKRNVRGLSAVNAMPSDLLGVLDGHVSLAFCNYDYADYGNQGDNRKAGKNKQLLLLYF